MTPKIFGTTLNLPTGAQYFGSAGPAEFAARWTEARLAYPLYGALAAQFQLAPPLYPALVSAAHIYHAPSVVGGSGAAAARVP